MTDKIRKVDYFAMEVPNKAGEAAWYLEALSAAGINLLAFSGFPAGRRAQLDFVPEDSRAFRDEARRAGIRLRAKKCFLVQGDDRPGAVARAMTRLADAGVNVTAVQAVGAGAGSFGAVIWVKSQDVGKATRALGAR
jgi:hypothetical protein